MSLKEQILDAIHPTLDLFTACEEADRIIAEAKQMKPGEQRTWYINKTTIAFTIKKAKTAVLTA